MDIFETIKAPKKRYGLPCINRFACESQRCLKKHDFFSKHCEEDCQSRINYDSVLMSDCIKADCPYLVKGRKGTFCLKFSQENQEKHNHGRILGLKSRKRW